MRLPLAHIASTPKRCQISTGHAIVSMLTISDVDVKGFGDDGPTDHGTSTSGAEGSLLGTIMLSLTSVQPSTPRGHVGTASAAPERPLIKKRRAAAAGGYRNGYSQ